MTTLAVILARAGSKGLPDKCVRPLLGRAVIVYTFDHAKSSRRLDGIVLTTDSQKAKELARTAEIEVVDRPAELVHDTATVDAAARHAVETWESRHNRRVDVAVLLYGNIPVRAQGLVDRAVDHLIASGASSVRSVAPVSKQHPDWVHRLDGDRMIQFRANSIYRRQDLEPIYYHDGAVAAVTRDALFGALRTPDDHQSFLGADRRAIIQCCDEAVDIDEPIDFHLAEALLRAQSGTGAADGLLRATGGLPASVENSGAFTIANRAVATGRPAFVIAEAGVNHNGNVETALKLIDAAAHVGADAVKFQMFRADTLTSAAAPTAIYQRASCHDVSQREMLKKLELSFADFARLKLHCDARKVQFLATPFGERELAALQELGAPAVKIASTDLTNTRLLDAACETGLPLIVSTGASTAEEIAACVRRLRDRGAAHRLVLLHCVSCYPTPQNAANLRAIPSLHRAFGLPVGISDHTTSTDTGAIAVAAGACVVEKHLTLDRSQLGPDHAMSLDPTQFAEYVRRIRQAEIALGTGDLGMTPIESEVRAVARKSVVAAASISRGTRLTAAMLTTKRPGTGISAGEIERLIGKTVATDIDADTLLTWDMLR